MGADQTPDPTTWSDDQLDNLLDALAQRAAERDDLDLPGSGASRRGVLAGLLGLGGAVAGAGVASAIGENESYGSSTGVTGTDSEPLNEANVQDLHAQDAQIDNLLEVAQLTVAGQSGVESPQSKLSNRSLDTTFTNNTGSPLAVYVEVFVAAGSASADDRIVHELFIDGSIIYADENQTSSGTGMHNSLFAIVPDGSNYALSENRDTTGSASLSRWHESQIGI